MTKAKRVIIIGAGIAGAAAAIRFEESNHTPRSNCPVEYSILEASDKGGGRIKTIMSPQGIIMNTGAHWLHNDIEPGAPGNPLLGLAHTYGLRTVRDTMMRDYYHSGRMTKLGKGDYLVKEARKAIKKFSTQSPGRDTALGALFSNSNLGNPLALRTTFGEAETGESVDKVSVRDLHELVSRNKGDFVREGLGEFFARYSQDIKNRIEFNKVVTRIRKLPGSQGVEVHTKDGDVYRADDCIATASVGVLI